ncbi:MAG TPA: glucokinase [Anaerolineales bacterium]|nr:glucokinase [Anaerolineales bacterium]
MNVLVGDIGGTKTILAVFSTESGPRKPLVEKTYQSTHYESFEQMVGEFLEAVKLPVDRACYGVAGPVVEGCARITNLTWVIDAAALQSAFNMTTVKLLNDLESVGYAIPILAPEDVHTINTGVIVPGGSIAILAPGTGLGEGFLTYDNGTYCAHASEGSHVSFAPVGALQIGLLNYMNTQGHKHVSFERVCSGGLGILNLYSYLKTTGLEEPDWLAEKLSTCEDPTPVIFNAAHDLHHPCKLASVTVDLFVAILGAEAGNLALKVLATGGIYLGGGISPRIIKDLESPEFLEALRSKGRFRQLLTNMPLHVIMNSKAGLLGAAAFGLAIPAPCQ